MLCCVYRILSIVRAARQARVCTCGDQIDILVLFVIAMEVTWQSKKPLGLATAAKEAHIYVPVWYSVSNI